MLLDYGADMDAQDEDGDTALALAIDNSNLDIAAMLVCRAANGHLRKYLDIAAMLKSKSAERAALISSPDLAAALWASLAIMPHLSPPLSSLFLILSIPTLSAGPPLPFQL